MSRLVPLYILLISGSVTLFLSPASTVRAQSPLKARLIGHIEYLAADERDGRGINTPGLDSAAAYIARHLDRANLDPLFGGSYRQQFMIGWGATAHPGTRFTYGDTTLSLGSGIQPAGFSSAATATAPVLFAGYGITASEYEYDDYAELDAEDKIVAVLAGEPARDDPEAAFAGEFDTDHAIVRTKAINAKMHGAAGLIILPYAADADTLPVPRTGEPYRDAGIPVAHITRADFGTLFPRADLAKLQRSIDVNESPRPLALGGEDATLAVEITRNEAPVANVGGKVEGDGEILVIGAHYDHLGYGQAGTREPGVRAVHNGADDNASGVTVLLELAREFAAEPPGPTVVFVAFTGEEAGLVGSSYFVNNPPLDLAAVKLMVNLDMVGRMQDEQLTVYGVNSAEGLRELAGEAGDRLARMLYKLRDPGVRGPEPEEEYEAAVNEYTLDLSLTGGGYGASDQTSFYAQGIPVLHLLTALHADYHTPRDDVDKIDGEGLTHVFHYAYQLVRAYAGERPELTYLRAEDPSRGRSRSDRNVSMGTIPDFTAPDSLRGYRLQGVTSGSPADSAGLHAMDVIVAIDHVIIDNIYDLTYVMGRHNPGDTVTIHYLRDGVEHETRLTFAPANTRRRGSE
ncbi:MAG: Aminopeptidase YwaD [Calditrichaeota bacterium]|nr:Aminopeptidase YwaD [Calditrichota bacterium]